MISQEQKEELISRIESLIQTELSHALKETPPDSETPPATDYQKVKNEKNELINFIETLEIGYSAT